MQSQIFPSNNIFVALAPIDYECRNIDKVCGILIPDQCSGTIFFKINPTPDQNFEVFQWRQLWTPWLPRGKGQLHLVPTLQAPCLDVAVSQL